MNNTSMPATLAENLAEIFAIIRQTDFISDIIAEFVQATGAVLVELKENDALTGKQKACRQAVSDTFDEGLGRWIESLIVEQGALERRLVALQAALQQARQKMQQARQGGSHETSP